MSIFAAAAAVLAADANLGVDATYTPIGGGAVAIRVVTRRPDEPIGGLDAPRGIAAALAAMIPRGALTAPPARGDELTIGAESFLVAEVLGDEAAASWTVHLRRRQPPG
jgi:hypothetical protein